MPARQICHENLFYTNSAEDPRSLKMTPQFKTDPILMDHWEALWNTNQNRSYLKQTQNSNPELWQAFYNKVSGVWDKMTGQSEKIGTALADRMIDYGIVRPGETLLDIGCGPGNLSFAMAQKKVHVTALDNSPGMIQVVKQRSKNWPGLPVTPLAADFRTFLPQTTHDVAAAVFFPEACTVKGLFSMERLAAKTCILVTGDGRETFPIRRDIWNQVMDISCPSAGFHMECAQNFLQAAGRWPKKFSLSLPVVLDAEEQEVKDYFSAYFAMFDTCPKKLGNAIQKALFPPLVRGRVQIKGKARLEALFWQVVAEEKKI